MHKSRERIIKEIISEQSAQRNHRPITIKDDGKSVTLIFSGQAWVEVEVAGKKVVAQSQKGKGYGIVRN